MCDNHRQHKHVRWSAYIKPQRFYTHHPFCSPQQSLYCCMTFELNSSMKPEEEFAFCAPGWAEELQSIEFYAFGKPLFSNFLFFFLIIYRGGFARKDHSTQKQEGPPLSAGHLWPPGQEADLQPAVTAVTMCVLTMEVYVFTTHRWGLQWSVMLGWFLCNKTDFRYFHFWVFCVCGRSCPTARVDGSVQYISVPYLHYSSALSLLFTGPTSHTSEAPDARLSSTSCCEKVSRIKVQRSKLLHWPEDRNKWIHLIGKNLKLFRVI